MQSTQPENRPAGMEPTPQRPRLPQEYGVPQDAENMLTWARVVERLEKGRNYWVCTVTPDGRPHAVPVWAGWLNDALYFDGHPMTKWGRNLKSNPAISVHLESGDEVVILEGSVEDIAQLDKERAEALTQLFMDKYEYAPNSDQWVKTGLLVLRPQRVLAWGEFPKTMTKWIFGK